MNVQILEKGGVPEYAVIPYADFEGLREAAESLNDLDAYHEAVKNMEAGNADFLPSDMVKRLCDGANPVVEWRKHRGMTQAKLGEAVGVTQASIAGIEKGKRDPSVKLLRKLADALGVDMDDLA